MPEITKRRVTMRTAVAAGFDPDGTPLTHVQVATDHVRPDFLDAYVAEARKRWQDVQVSDEPDAGPGGYDGQTVVPRGLDHDLSGTTFAATGVTEQQAQAQFSTVTLRNARGAGGTALMTHVALQSTAAAATAGTALSGARAATSWATWASSTSSTTQTNNVASGETVASLALYNASTAGTFQASVDVTSQTFSSAGTYQSTITDTQS